jgi:hypothetical protein
VTRPVHARQSRPPRWLRGSVLAVASTLLGLAAHAIAGGMSPHPSVLLPLAVVTAAAGAVLAGDNPRPTRVIGVLAASQLAMRVLFAVGLQAHPHAGPPTGAVTMAAGHAAAVIAIGLMLVHADTVLVCLADAVAVMLPVRWTQPPPAPRLVTCRPRRVGSDRRRQAVQLARSCPRRGPPCID